MDLFSNNQYEEFCNQIGCEDILNNQDNGNDEGIKGLS